MYNNSEENINNETSAIVQEFLRYFTFWPYFLISIIFFVVIAFTYLRYTENIYESQSIIQIIDKAQDSEMALPTAMTVFNRSMINLENEIGVLNSYSLHERVIKNLNFNVNYYSSGLIKKTHNHSSDWFNGSTIEFNEEIIDVKNDRIFDIIIKENKLIIREHDSDDELIDEYYFDNLNSYSKNNLLPFNIQVNSSEFPDTHKIIKISPLKETINYFRNAVSISQVGSDSDQLKLTIQHPNPKVANEYLNALMSEFDKDGVRDRQLEYKRTMDFVDNRSVFLLNELNAVELRRQQFKEENNLTDIKSDANINIAQKFNYDSDLFKSQSQLDLLELLKKSINNNDYKLMPINIGIDNTSLNSLIGEYNLIVKERDRYMLSAGKNNSFIKSFSKQLDNYLLNIRGSIENYQNSLEQTILNLEKKESEFSVIYKEIPKNEKILRSIEREMEVKESLFILLLQKREEAAINYAVVKPSIKIIDYAINKSFPVSPNKFLIFLLSFVFAILFPFIILFIVFALDNKIHTRTMLSELVKDIPIIGELPHILNNSELNELSDSYSRSPLAESIRMVSANLKFSKIDDSQKGNNIILVTSSVKGEGKTIVSTNLASVLCSKSAKVLLIGADLRNPQIHKFLNIDKSTKGLSDYIYLNGANWKDHLIKDKPFDILLSGKIPPNPTQLLASEKFKDLLNETKNIYDHIIIDSAPCLLVSDTFEISKYVGTTIYVVRSNYSEKNLASFINESHHENKLNNMQLVLNAVGSSKSYGYKYGYQYGYRYGYKYGYNYGYGYGYSEESS